MKRPDRGFTLLEVVIALAVAALGIAAVAKATGGAATVASETRERMLAVWVAGNHFAELRISRSWPAPGSSHAERSMGGRTWYLTQTVSNTDVENIRRVDVEVYTDQEHENREYRTFSFVPHYTSPDDTQQDREDRSGSPRETEDGDQTRNDPAKESGRGVARAESGSTVLASNATVEDGNEAVR